MEFLCLTVLHVKNSFLLFNLRRKTLRFISRTVTPTAIWLDPSQSPEIPEQRGVVETAYICLRWCWNREQDQHLLCVGKASCSLCSQDGWGWKGPVEFTCSIPLLRQGHLQLAACTLSRRLLKIYKKGDCMSSLGNLCQCSVTHAVQECFLMLWQPLVFQFVPTSSCPGGGHRWVTPRPTLCHPEEQKVVGAFAVIAPKLCWALHGGQPAHEMGTWPVARLCRSATQPSEVVDMRRAHYVCPEMGRRQEGIFWYCCELEWSSKFWMVISQCSLQTCKLVLCVPSLLFSDLWLPPLLMFVQ